MRGLSPKIGTKLQPVFVSRKLEQNFQPKEIKSPIVNQQCVVYLFCFVFRSVRCDVGCTFRHLRQHIQNNNSMIGNKFESSRGHNPPQRKPVSHTLKVPFIKERNPTHRLTPCVKTLSPKEHSYNFYSLVINYCFT